MVKWDEVEFNRKSLKLHVSNQHTGILRLLATAAYKQCFNTAKWSYLRIYPRVRRLFHLPSTEAKYVYRPSMHPSPTNSQTNNYFDVLVNINRVFGLI